MKVSHLQRIARERAKPVPSKKESAPKPGRDRSERPARREEGHYHKKSDRYSRPPGGPPDVRPPTRPKPVKQSDS